MPKKPRISRVWAYREASQDNEQAFFSFLLGLDRGVLVLFDRRPSAVPLEERIAFEDALTPSGYAVTILRA